MVDHAYITRIQEKTVVHQLLNELRVGYGYPPTIAQSIVDTVTKVLTPPLSREADVVPLRALRFSFCGFLPKVLVHRETGTTKNSQNGWLSTKHTKKDLATLATVATTLATESP